MIRLHSAAHLSLLLVTINIISSVAVNNEKITIKYSVSGDGRSEKPSKYDSQERHPIRWTDQMNRELLHVSAIAKQNTDHEEEIFREWARNYPNLSNATTIQLKKRVLKLKRERFGTEYEGGKKPKDQFELNKMEQIDLMGIWYRNYKGLRHESLFDIYREWKLKYPNRYDITPEKLLSEAEQLLKKDFIISIDRVPIKLNWTMKVERDQAANHYSRKRSSAPSEITRLAKISARVSHHNYPENTSQTSTSINNLHIHSLQPNFLTIGLKPQNYSTQVHESHTDRISMPMSAGSLIRQKSNLSNQQIREWFLKQKQQTCNNNNLTRDQGHKFDQSSSAFLKHSQDQINNHQTRNNTGNNIVQRPSLDHIINLNFNYSRHTEHSTALKVKSNQTNNNNEGPWLFLNSADDPFFKDLYSKDNSKS